MMIPKQLDWQNHMFKEREKCVSSNDNVSCALYGTVCAKQCEDCTWMKEISIVNDEKTITCQPPVIWEE